MGSRKKKAGRGRYAFSRPPASRVPRPVVVLVCDDTKTAVAYFTELKREVREKVTLKVVCAPRQGASPDEVVECAVEQKEALDPAEGKDSVWALIDMEAERAKRAKAERAKLEGEGKGIGVALSDPCYEVWTLAHLADTGEGFKDCGAVVGRIRVEWKKAFGEDFGKKGQADYAKLMPLRGVAVARARVHHGREDPSRTEVFEVMEEIDGLADGG